MKNMSRKWGRKEHLNLNCGKDIYSTIKGWGVGYHTAGTHFKILHYPEPDHLLLLPSPFTYTLGQQSLVLLSLRNSRDGQVQYIVETASHKRRRVGGKE